MGFIKISKNVTKLNDIEALVLSILTIKSLNEDGVLRKYIGKIIDCTEEHVSRITEKLQDLGFIRKEYTYTTNKFTGEISQFCKYNIINPENFTMIPIEFIMNSEIPIKLRGFYIKLLTLAFSDSHMIRENRKWMAEKLNMSYSYFLKKFKILLDKGFITFIEDEGYLLNVHVDIENKTKLSNNRMEDLSRLEENYLYKKHNNKRPTLHENLADWYIKKEIYTQINANSIFDYIVSCNPKKKFKEVIKDISKEYQFE